MRKNLFRAWDTQQKIMVHYDVNYIYIKFNGQMVCIDNNGEEDSPGDLILMEWTGLLDKNGKEIYEGDIIKTQFEDLKNLIVVFRDGGFSPEAYHDSSLCRGCEIIGNIYENPELLKGDEE